MGRIHGFVSNRLENQVRNPIVHDDFSSNAVPHFVSKVGFELEFRFCVVDISVFLRDCAGKNITGGHHFNRKTFILPVKKCQTWWLSAPDRSRWSLPTEIWRGRLTSGNAHVRGIVRIDSR